MTGASDLLIFLTLCNSSVFFLLLIDLFEILNLEEAFQWHTP